MEVLFRISSAVFWIKRKHNYKILEQFFVKKPVSIISENYLKNTFSNTVAIDINITQNCLILSAINTAQSFGHVQN